MKDRLPIHAYRLEYFDRPHAPEKLWEWEKEHSARLLWNASTFGRELVHRYFPTWHALAAANQRIWARDYLPRQPISPGRRGRRGWMSIVRSCRDMQDIYEAQYGVQRDDANVEP